jgi:branched-chain amino acid transport system substrate-binding protein
MMRTKAVPVALALGAALALAACGSSSSKASAPSSSSSSSSSSSTAPTSAKISATLLLSGDLTGQVFTMPEIVPTVKGEFRNLPGVKIETCDSKGTANGGLACEEKAIADHVDGVILGAGYITQNSALLLKAGIPVIGSADTTSANSFAVVSTNAEFAGIGIGLANAGCTKLGTVYYDGTSYLADLIKKGIESKGGTEVARSAVALNAADLAPSIAKITGAGANCVAVSLAPTAAAQALTAIKQSGKTLTVGSVSAVFSQQLINSLGAGLTNGLVVVDSQLNGADDAPGIAAIKADIASQNSTAPVTQLGIVSWAAGRVVQAALAKVQGTVTPASLTTALNGLRNVDMDGVIHSWSSVELSNPAYRRLFNHYGITYTVNNLKATNNGDFFDFAGSSALQ